MRVVGRAVVLAVFGAGVPIGDIAVLVVLVRDLLVARPRRGRGRATDGAAAEEGLRGGHVWCALVLGAGGEQGRGLGWWKLRKEEG